MEVGSLGEAALGYARRGIPVFPAHTPLSAGGEWICSCNRRPCPDKVGKHPRTKRGHLEATTDEDQVLAWWKKWPDANIGGRVPEGRFVLDLDGAEALAWWLTQEWVETRTAVTGGGGRHLWLCGHARQTVKLASGPDWQVDVRTSQGYVLLPPSLHPSGRRYEWTDERDSVEAPGWLMELVAVRPSPNGATPYSDDEPIAEGGRNAELTRIAGRLRREAVDAATIETALLAINQRRCRPPLDPDEVRIIANSVARYEPDPHRGIKIAATEDGMPADRPQRNVGEHPEPDFGRPKYGGRIVLSEPPIHRWSFEGVDGELELLIGDLEGWARVRRLFAERFHHWPNWTPPGQTRADQEASWRIVIVEWFQKAIKVAVPRDLTRNGVVRGILEQLTQLAGDDPQGVASDGVWLDPERQEYIFRTSRALELCRAMWPPEWRSQRGAAQQFNEELRESFAACERNLHLEDGRQIRCLAVPKDRVG